MAIIWGTNFSIIKSAARELDPQAFNAVRMAVASAAFLLVMGAARLWPASRGAGTPQADASAIFRSAAPLTGHDWLRLAGLGVVGHVLYQFLFIGGLSRTSVANSSLMLATTPVVIAVVSAVLGYERIGRMHWLGAAISTAGLYLVVGRGFALGGERMTGDLMMLGAVCCWALYTLAARPLMSRHSPVAVTGLSMAFGTVVYVTAVWPKVQAVDWLEVSGLTLGLLVYSALFALCLLYTISVCRRPPDWQRPHCRLFESHPGRSDGVGRAVPGGADGHAEAVRRGGSTHGSCVHACRRRLEARRRSEFVGVPGEATEVPDFKNEATKLTEKTEGSRNRRGRALRGVIVDGLGNTNGPLNWTAACFPIRPRSPPAACGRSRRSEGRASSFPSLASLLRS